MKGILSKYTVWKADLLKGHQVYYLQTCMCALFSPENFTGISVKGLKERKKKRKKKKEKKKKTSWVYNYNPCSTDSLIHIG